jgi:tetraacyldisaccharide 4'-kinase
MNLPLALRVLLWPFSLVYGAYVRARAALYDQGWLKPKRLSGKVISVGNVTVGGTGKTPMVMWLAGKFVREGKRVAILSRGYRGTGGTSDEVELMKARLGDRVRFGVGKDRFEEGRRLEEQSPVDVFLLDDGFQHRQLARDVDIVMLDATRPVKGSLLPAGPIREPASAYSRADILVVTRKSEPHETEAFFSNQSAIFHAQSRLLGFRSLGEDSHLRCVNELGPGPFFAFCGIGNPAAFFQDLTDWHLPLAGKKSFRDHHRYSAHDLSRLKEEALKAGAVALVTTEKDACNIIDARPAGLPIQVAAVDLVFSSEGELDAVLARKLATVAGSVGATA